MGLLAASFYIIWGHRFQIINRFRNQLTNVLPKSDFKKCSVFYLLSLWMVE